MGRLTFKSRAQRHYWSFGCWVGGRGERALIVRTRRWKNQQSVQSRMGASCRPNFVMEKHSHSNIKYALVLLIKKSCYDNVLYQSVCAWHIVYPSPCPVVSIWLYRKSEEKFQYSVLIGVHLESPLENQRVVEVVPVCSLRGGAAVRSRGTELLGVTFTAISPRKWRGPPDIRSRGNDRQGCSHAGGPRLRPLQWKHDMKTTEKARWGIIELQSQDSRENNKTSISQRAKKKNYVRSDEMYERD